MKKIMVLGSLNIDLVTRVSSTPKKGETVLGNELSKIPGGKGANQAVAIGRIGGSVSMLGKIGNDEFGKILKENLLKNNVNCNFLFSVDTVSTGTALIMVNEDGDNSIVVIPGANFKLFPDDIKKEMFEDTDYLLAQLETPTESIEYAFKIAKEKGIYTVLNPAPAKELSDSLIKNTDLLIPNETEFETLTGHSTATKEEFNAGLRLLFEKDVKAVLVTLGKKGARYIDMEGKDITVPAYKVNAVDTTAAGDSFIGGFLTSLSAGHSVEDSMEVAVKVAAITVSRFGAQNSLPTKDELNSFKGVR
ncbi:MAG: ribokinase [Fusobacteriaceae bacterium]|nr:ribokinase [Fusobacteriaceae bacterium]